MSKQEIPDCVITRFALENAEKQRFEYYKIQDEIQANKKTIAEQGFINILSAAETFSSRVKFTNVHLKIKKAKKYLELRKI